MFNPQSYAVFIEQKLRDHSLASYGDADLIRRAPFEFLDNVLKIYERQSKETENRAADLWDKYEDEIRLKLSIDQLGEERAQILLEDVKALFL